MTRSLVSAVALLSLVACSNQASPAPCAGDANCPTGSYCASGGKCAALPGAFSVTLAQSTATVTVGSTFQFSVTSVGGVTWSVEETFGGTVDPNGTYHAPETPGTYHVVATSTADGTKSATATVTAVPAPSAAIEVASVLTRGKTGVTAQVPSAAGITYAWQVTGGTLTSAADGNQITFTAGTGASMLVAVTVTNVASTAASNDVAITLVDPPTAPTIAAVQTVTAGKAGLSASITPLTGLSYAWSITNGTITAGAATDAITYVSGSGSALTLSCAATNEAGDTATGTFNETLVPAPTQAQISAPLQLTQGATGTAQVTNLDSSLTYQWTISGGTFTDATAGANGTTDTGATVSYAVSASANIATLSCTAVNAAGDAAAAGTANINLVAPSAAAITAPTTVTAGKAGYTASVVAQAGASYAWTISGGTITSSSSLSSITFTAGAGSGTPPILTLSCTVTNSAGTPASASVNVAVAPVPIAPVIAAKSDVTQGNGNATATVSNASASFTYDWSITGGTFNGATPSTTASGTQVTYTAGTGLAVQLTCTAVNAAGDSLASSFSVTLIVPPLAPTFGGKATVSQGYSSSASVSNVPSPNTGNAQLTYQWSISGGTLTSAANTTQVTYSAGSGTSLTLTCTATNVAGDSAQSSLVVTLVPAPLTPGITAPQYLSVNKTVALALINTQANTSYAWTVSNAGTAGYLDPNNSANIIATASGLAPTFAAGANPGTPTLHVTATNAAGDTESASATLQVVAIPAAPTLSITSPNAGYAGYLTQGKQNVSATITNPVTDGSVTYQWTISGGGFTTGNATATSYPVTFNAGYGSSVTLTATAYNKANDPSPSASASDTLVPLAAAPTLSAAKALISAGLSGQSASIKTPVSGQTYYWSITNGTFDGTGGSTSTTGTSVLFTATTGVTQVTLSAYVLNQAGDPGTNGSIAISVVPAPLAPTLNGALIVSGGKTSLSASVGNQQTGESYVWTMTGNGTINGSAVAGNGSTTETSNSIAYTSGSPGQITITIQGTNQAGDSASSTTTVTVVPQPSGVVSIARYTPARA